MAEIFEISLSELVEPNKNEEESAFEKERHEKKSNPILQANLIKWAIIFQTAFLTSSVIHISEHLDNMDDNVYLGLIIFDLSMLAICSTWVTSNHRYEPDRNRRRKNINIELGYCCIQALTGLATVRFGIGLAGELIIIAVALVYILYINPKFMGRKLTK